MHARIVMHEIYNIYPYRYIIIMLFLIIIVRIKDSGDIVPGALSDG